MRLIDADALNIRKYTRWFENVEDVRQVERMIREAPTIAQSPNDPLTLEQLREMCGEPVWIERHDEGCPIGYAIVGDFMSPYGVYFGTAHGGLRLPYDEYGKTCLAYRRKPEEGTT